MIINKVMKLSKKNKEYIIPFNIEGIPIEYECLRLCHNKWLIFDEK